MGLNKVLVDQLYSSKEAEVIKAIDLICVEGSLEYIPALLSAFENTKSGEIKRKINNLLNDVKDSKIAPIIVEYLQNEISEDVMSMLLTACWSSGVDYSQYLSVFVQIVLESDYFTAFESLTVIDNMEGVFDNSVLQQYIDKLQKASLETGNSKKRGLLVELISVLEQMKSV